MMRPIVLATVLALAACAGGTTLASTEIALTTTERAATAYVSLPRCPVTDGTLCSDAAIAAKIKVADNVAYAAVKSASLGTVSLTDAMAAVTSLASLIPAK